MAMCADCKTLQVSSRSAMVPPANLEMMLGSLQISQRRYQCSLLDCSTVWLRSTGTSEQFPEGWVEWTTMEPPSQPIGSATPTRRGRG
jgi:hypothetical protein